MSNQWLRLWHEMPNDPKWKTIARVSGQPIALVQAMYLHLLVDASRNVTRGHVTIVTEDLASALDVTENQIEAIFSAMQGRVLEDQRLSGWDARQPKKEDVGNEESGALSATERKRLQREREKQAELLAQENDKSRDVTKSHAREDKDKDKDKDKELKNNKPSAQKKSESFSPAEALEKLGVDAQTSADWLEHRKTKKAKVTQTVLDQHRKEAEKAGLSLQDALKISCSRGWIGFEAKFLEPRTASKSFELCWYASDDLIKRKGNTLGMEPRPGESMNEFKARIQQRIDGVQPPSPSRAPPVVPPTTPEKRAISSENLQKMHAAVGRSAA